MHFNVHEALFTIANIPKKPKYPSTDEWIKKKQAYIHICVCINI